MTYDTLIQPPQNDKPTWPSAMQRALGWINKYKANISFVLFAISVGLGFVHLVTNIAPRCECDPCLCREP